MENISVSKAPKVVEKLPDEEELQRSDDEVIVEPTIPTIIVEEDLPEAEQINSKQINMIQSIIELLSPDDLLEDSTTVTNQTSIRPRIMSMNAIDNFTIPTPKKIKEELTKIKVKMK